MKKNNFIKQTLVALTFAVAVAVMVPAAGSVDAQAAKKVTSNKIPSKAPSVKTGTTTVISKKTPTSIAKWLQFKAPKAGTYKITASNFKPANESSLGGFSIYSKKTGSSFSDLKTQGGRNRRFSICSKAYYQAHKQTEPKNERYLTSRYAIIKLKKGEAIYIRMFYTNNERYTYSLKIQKIK